MGEKLQTANRHMKKAKLSRDERKQVKMRHTVCLSDRQKRESDSTSVSQDVGTGISHLSWKPKWEEPGPESPSPVPRQSPSPCGPGRNFHVRTQKRMLECPLRC